MQLFWQHWCKITGLALLCLQLSFNGWAQTHRYPVIPYPATLLAAEGDFLLTKNTRLVKEAGGRRFENERGFLQQILRGGLGDTLEHSTGNSKSTIIEFRYDASLEKPEAYRVAIQPNRIVLSAREGAGMYYAIETIRQLMPATVENSVSTSLKLPAVDIRDAPAFGWRGMHIDVSRHFFTMEYLRKYVDRMAFYKLNKLHLHLTDDQGWRLEIKKYPLLTSVGAWRSFERHDSLCMKEAAITGNPDFIIDPRFIKQVDGKTRYGGFYTQAEMKAFITYAQSKHVEVIPEIDMPGHMEAATRAYPWLTCDTTLNKGQGFSTPICPCKEEVIDFSQNILTEIASLFPSRYIHIGGDEVNTANWSGTAVGKAFMKAEGMSKPSDIQVYFNKRMQQHLKSLGKTLLGWDELVETGIDSSATIMFWRNWAGDLPAKATANRNRLIMCPVGPYYFDMIPDKNSVLGSYQYNPLDSSYGIGPENEHLVMGVQANLWTETIPTEARADYMVFPRLTAMAEVGWTYRNLYPDYLNRLAHHYPRLDNMEVRYRMPDLDGLMEDNVFVKQKLFFVQSPSDYYKIRYSDDGSLPVPGSAELTDSLLINRATELKLALFAPNGHRGDVYTLRFRNSNYYTSITEAAHLSAGLDAVVFKGAFSRVANMPAGTAGQHTVVSQIVVPQPAPGNTFGMRFNGYINVPENGIYNFYLNCNDGGVLWIADEKIIDNDGLHSDREKGGQIALEKGLHPMMLEFFDAGGGYKLELNYSVGNGAAQPIPKEWFRHR